MKTITHQSLSRLELGHEGWKEDEESPRRVKGTAPRRVKEGSTKGEGRVPRRKGEG